MNSKKGFTLVELLVTIVILGIVIAISIFSYVKIKNNSLEKNLEAKLSIAEIAAYKYGNDNKDDIWETKQCSYIKISKLISEGYLASDIKDVVFYENPIDGSDLSNKSFKICYGDSGIMAGYIDYFPAFLNSITVSVGNLIPKFNKDIYSYTI